MSKTKENVAKQAYKLAVNHYTEMVETEDEFIFTTVSKWLSNAHQITISKELLIDAIKLHQKTYPEKWGREINNAQ